MIVGTAVWLFVLLIYSFLYYGDSSRYSWGEIEDKKESK
jgi:hypothetical protein